MKDDTIIEEGIQIMKIGIQITTTQDQFAQAGIGRYTEEIVAGLSEIESEHELILFAYDGSSTLDDPVLSDVKTKVQVVRCGSVRTSNPFNFLWYKRELFPAIKDSGVDVFFQPFFLQGLPSSICPTYVMIHDLAQLVLGKYSSGGFLRELVKKVEYKLAWRELRKCRGILVNSNSTKRDVVKRLGIEPGKVEVAYLGLSEKFREIPETDRDKELLARFRLPKNYVLYYSGIDPNKNVEALLKVWKRVVTDPELSDYKLVLLGKAFTDEANPRCATIKELISDLGVDESIVVTGGVSDEELIQILNGASLFVHLSRYEGFGFSVLEAQKCGVSVVANKIPAYEEVLGDSATLVDAQNEENVASVVKGLLLDKDKLMDLRQKGKVNSAKYNWNSTVEKTYKYLTRGF